MAAIMSPSIEQVQQWVKRWIVGVDPEVEIQVRPFYESPRESGQVIPVRIGRRGYVMTVAFPERSFPASPLPDETCQTLERVIQLLRYMEAHGLRRPGQADEES
jgi:hypothetical protein